MDMSASAAPAATDPAPANGLPAFGASLDKAAGAAFALHPPFFLNLKEKEPASPRKERSVPDVAMLDEAALPSPRSKRQASPTELVHEGRSGNPRLSKRPSVKRKSRSSDEDEGASRDTPAHGEAAVFGFEAMGLPPTKSTSATGAAASGSGSR